MAGTDSNPLPLGSGLIPQIDETLSSGTRAPTIIRLIEDEWLNWLVDQKKISSYFQRWFSKFCQHDASEWRYYDICVPATLSRPYVLSLGCLADPGQPSTHALLGEPSAQNWMGRIQLCPHSYPESHSKQHNQVTFLTLRVVTTWLGRLI